MCQDVCEYAIYAGMHFVTESRNIIQSLMAKNKNNFEAPPCKFITLECCNIAKE
ncbi:unnamed protein product [marine sediment metagenome]|uniref:Uncharacterized protein n=1 Tax=marine sediment metagenome TaxID=412755 RepID=X0Z4W8_9ZZZZ